MKTESIAFEAHKIYEKTGMSQEECWKQAEINLSIFPEQVRKLPSSSKPSNGNPSSIYGIHDYATNAGSFGLIYSLHDLFCPEHCRELFEKYMQEDFLSAKNFGPTTYKTDEFLFLFTGSLLTDTTANVANFIRESEYRLNLVHLTKFQKSNNKNCLWITLSDFWKQETIRLSLFTILLRCGINYHNNNYDEALSSITYSQNTLYAIKLFLSGRTRFTGLHNWSLRHNWVRIFQNVSEYATQQLLVA